MTAMRTFASALAGVAVCLLAATASAQYAYKPVSRSNPATGEKYNVEVATGLWFPNASAVVSSESLGIIGSQIDLVNDLGVVDAKFPDFRLVVRPGRKHKLRFQFTPIKYEAEATLSRDIIFNGIVFPIRLPVTSSVDWKAWRFGYEYDFLYRDRGFLGVIVEAKYTDVNVSLQNPLSREFTEAKAPIPALGIIGRGYIAPNIAITGEFTGFKMPGDFSEGQDAGQYFELDVYGTLNFTHNVGVQGGYRSLAVKYQINDDYGDLKLDGFYFNGVVRF
jgi:hypothetical protein